MFPEKDKNVMKEIFKIQNTMRILPHDQNSGGFFMALLKKISDIYELPDI